MNACVLFQGSNFHPGQSYSLPHYSFIKVYACEHYEDDPYSSFAFGGGHCSDVHTKFRVKNQHCTVSLRSPEVHIKGDGLKANLALIIFWRTRQGWPALYHQPSTMKQMWLTMVDTIKFNTAYLQTSYMFFSTEIFSTQIWGLQTSHSKLVRL